MYHYELCRDHVALEAALKSGTTDATGAYLLDRVLQINS